MTAIPGLEEAIETSGSERAAHRGAPVGEVMSGLEDWVSVYVRTLWQRWPCDGDACPARPEWDRALDDAVFDGKQALAPGLQDDVLKLVTRRLREFAERFQREHPEAVLRPVEDAA